MAALGTAVDLARIGSNLSGVWHIVQAREYGSLEALGAQADIVETLCGRRQKQAGDLERDVDANVVQHKGVKVCADCKTIIDAGGGPQKEERPMSTTTTEKKTTAKKAPAREEKPISAADLKKAIARAERAIASQPARTERELTERQADDAHRLGKSIAADRWNLKQAKAGKTSAVVVAGMVERIESRVQERNKIRLGN